MMRLAALSLAAIFAVAAPVQAQGLEERLTIVTSFSRDVTTPFVKAFQRRHPGTRVEIQNRSTTAGVAFIR